MQLGMLLNQGEKIMEGVTTAPTFEDSLKREAQGRARQYVSKHRMSPSAWSSTTLRPSAEAEFISSASCFSPVPHKFKFSRRLKVLALSSRLL